MSTKLAVTVVGTVVGAYFGYPQLGAMAGALIGSAIDPTVIQGPKIKEAGSQTVAEGVPRPIIFGTGPTTGNVMQRGPLIIREVKESQGKGSTKVKSEKAYRTYAIGICEGPMAGILRVWRNKKLVYDIRAGSGMVAESQRWAANKRFYMGSESQLPDPDLELLDADATAHRGTVYMVAIEDDLTDMQGSIPQYEFEVTSTLNPPEIANIDASAVIPVYNPTPVQYSYVYLNNLPASSPNYLINVGVASMLSNSWLKNGSINHLLHELDESCSIVSTTNTAVNGGNWSLAVPTPSSGFFPLGRYGSTILCRGTSYPSGIQLYLTNGGALSAVLCPDAASTLYWFGTNAASADVSTPRYLWMNSAGIYLGVRNRDATTYNNSIYFWPLGASGGPTSFRVDSGASIPAINVTPANDFLMHLGRDGKLRTINDAGVYKVYSAGLALESSQTLAFYSTNITAFAVEGDLAVFAYRSSGGFVEIRNSSSWSVTDTYANSTFSSKPDAGRIIFTDESVFYQCQDSVLRSDYGSGSVGAPVLLSSIVSALYQRCGVKSLQYDVSELTDLVKGYPLASAGYTAADAVDATRLGYFFDKCVRDKKIYHPKRGKAVAKTLTYLDLTSAADNNRREQANEIPYKLNVRYPNPDSGYAVLKETTGSISPDRRTTGEVTLDVPVCLGSDEAAQIADKQYKVTLAEMDGTMELPVMLDVALDLAEGDCIGYVDRLGQTYRLRIEQMEFADWSIKLTCKADRQSAYTSDVTGIPAPEPTLPPSTIVGETVFAIIDGPARTDSEDQLGLLGAVTGPLPPWYGAELQRSLDGGANYTEVAQFVGADILGVLIEDVPSASPYYTDTTNTVKVQLYRDGQTIDTMSDVQFLTGQGVFALENPDGSWEYMQGRDVSDEGSNVFHLETLHRGLLNTDSSQGHVEGAKFVWLRDATFLPASSAWLGLDLTHRAVSYDDTEDDTTNDESRTFYGESQREWPVEFLALDRDMSDVVSGTWVPRARFGSPMNPVQSSNFQGFRVTVDDGSISVSFDVTTASFTYDASAMSSPVTVSVSALNRITGAGPAVSDTV